MFNYYHYQPGSNIITNIHQMYIVCFNATYSVLLCSIDIIDYNRLTFDTREERTTENKMERRVSTRFEKYWTESGRGDGQGDVEKKDHQLYRRPYMMGKAEEKKKKKKTFDTREH